MTPKKDHALLKVCRGSTAARSPYAQVLGRCLSAVRHELIVHLLAFIECRKSGPLDGRDVNEHVLAAVFRLNEPVALGGVEPLHSPCRHVDLRKEIPPCAMQRIGGFITGEKAVRDAGRWAKTVQHRAREGGGADFILRAAWQEAGADGLAGGGLGE